MQALLGSCQQDLVLVGYVQVAVCCKSPQPPLMREMDWRPITESVCTPLRLSGDKDNVAFRPVTCRPPICEHNNFAYGNISTPPTPAPLLHPPPPRPHDFIHRSLLSVFAGDSQATAVSVGGSTIHNKRASRTATPWGLISCNSAFCETYFRSGQRIVFPSVQSRDERTQILFFFFLIL